MIAMALTQPPAEAELATKRDVETAVGRVERRLERLEDKLDRVIERLGSFLTKDEFAEHMKHYATAADVERIGRVLAFWVVGSVFALITGMLVALWKMTNTIVTVAG